MRQKSRRQEHMSREKVRPETGREAGLGHGWYKGNAGAIAEASETPYILQTVFGRAVIFIMLLLISTNVFAYLDPSTGSMIVSAIVGIIASLALAVKTYWYKMKGLFRRDKKPVSDPTEDTSNQG